MPDFERRSSASFISSKEGGTPDSFSRSLMKSQEFILFAREHLDQSPG